MYTFYCDSEVELQPTNNKDCKSIRYEDASDAICNTVGSSTSCADLEIGTKLVSWFGCGLYT